MSARNGLPRKWYQVPDNSTKGPGECRAAVRNYPRENRTALLPSYRGLSLHLA
jgi:hypothetical protein